MIIKEPEQRIPVPAFFDQRLSKPLTVPEITMAMNGFLNQDEAPNIFIVIREKKSGLLRAFSLRKDQIEKKAANWFVLSVEGQEKTPSMQALYDWDQVHSETGVKINMFGRYAGELFSEKGFPENMLLFGNYSQYKVLLMHPYIRKPEFVEQRLPYKD